MIAAGITPKALSTYMGHSSITITLDRYGHLLPGNEQQAATMLDQVLHEHEFSFPSASDTPDHSCRGQLADFRRVP